MRIFVPGRIWLSALWRTSLITLQRSVKSLSCLADRCWELRTGRRRRKKKFSRPTRCFNFLQLEFAWYIKSAKFTSIHPIVVAILRLYNLYDRLTCVTLCSLSNENLYIVGNWDTFGSHWHCHFHHHQHNNLYRLEAKPGYMYLHNEEHLLHFFVPCLSSTAYSTHRLHVKLHFRKNWGILVWKSKAPEQAIKRRTKVT